MQSDQRNSTPFGSPWALWFPSRGHLCSQSGQYFAHLKMLRNEPGEEREKGALGRGSRYKVPEDREIFIHPIIPSLIHLPGVPQAPCWTQPVLGDKGLC